MYYFSIEFKTNREARGGWKKKPTFFSGKGQEKEKGLGVDLEKKRWMTSKL